MSYVIWALTLTIAQAPTRLPTTKKSLCTLGNFDGHGFDKCVAAGCDGLHRAEDSGNRVKRVNKDFGDASDRFHTWTKENEVCAAQTGVSHHGWGMGLKWFEGEAQSCFSSRSGVNGFRQDPLKFLHRTLHGVKRRNPLTPLRKSV